MSAHQHTQCPICEAILQVDARMLVANDTRVRCGECLAVFSAGEHLIGDYTSRGTLTEDEMHDNWAEETLSEVSPELLARIDEALGMSGTTASAASLSAPPSAPSPAPSLGPASNPPAASLAATPVVSPKPPAAQPPKDQHAVAGIHPAAPSAVPPKLQEASEEAGARIPRRHRGNSLVAGESGHWRQSVLGETPVRRDRASLMLLSFVLLVLTFVVVLSMSFVNRISWAQEASMRPLVLMSCAVLGCQVEARRDLSALKKLSERIFEHPRIDNALVVTVRLRNDASFAQPYPILIVTLYDLAGNTAATGTFSPQKYLSDFREGRLMQPQQEVEVTLEVADPGPAAGGGDVVFR